MTTAAKPIPATVWESPDVGPEAYLEHPIDARLALRLQEFETQIEVIPRDPAIPNNIRKMGETLLDVYRPLLPCHLEAVPEKKAYATPYGESWILRETPSQARFGRLRVTVGVSAPSISFEVAGRSDGTVSVARCLARAPDGAWTLTRELTEITPAGAGTGPGMVAREWAAIRAISAHPDSRISAVPSHVFSEGPPGQFVWRRVFQFDRTLRATSLHEAYATCRAALVGIGAEESQESRTRTDAVLPTTLEHPWDLDGLDDQLPQALYERIRDFADATEYPGRHRLAWYFWNLDHAEHPIPGISHGAVAWPGEIWVNREFPSRVDDPSTGST